MLAGPLLATRAFDEVRAGLQLSRRKYLESKDLRWLGGCKMNQARATN